MNKDLFFLRLSAIKIEENSKIVYTAKEENNEYRPADNFAVSYFIVDVNNKIRYVKHSYFTYLDTIEYMLNQYNQWLREYKKLLNKYNQWLRMYSNLIENNKE
jgi:hypothetical protein